MRIKQQQSRERDFSKSLPNVIWRRTAKAPLFCAPVPNLGIRFGSERVSGSSLIWGVGWVGGGEEGRGALGSKLPPLRKLGREKRMGWGGHDRPGLPREVAHGASALRSSRLCKLRSQAPGAGAAGRAAEAARARALRGPARARALQPTCCLLSAPQVPHLRRALGPLRPGRRALGDRGVGGPGAGARPHPPR